MKFVNPDSPIIKLLYELGVDLTQPITTPYEMFVLGLIFVAGLFLVALLFKFLYQAIRSTGRMVH